MYAVLVNKSLKATFVMLENLVTAISLRHANLDQLVNDPPNSEIKFKWRHVFN